MMYVAVQVDHLLGAAVSGSEWEDDNTTGWIVPVELGVSKLDLLWLLSIMKNVLFW